MKSEHGNTNSEFSGGDLGKLEVGEIKNTTAGLGAITDTLKNTYGKMGVVRGTRALLKLNQKGGIDCQSCAWADPPEHRTFAEFCENGAKAMADEGTTERLTPEFFAEYSVAELSAQTDRWLNAQGRLTEPMILREGATHYEPVSWEDAFQTLAAELNSLASPDEAVFYTSGRTSNEAAFLYQLFARQFGTNNLPDCSNMCHESTSVALVDSIGLGKASIRLEDLENTDLIIIIGQNPGTNAPRMMSSLQKAKQNGARIIAVNPMPEAGLMNFVNPNPQHYPNPLKFPVDVLGNHPTELADLHLPLRIGGDMAFLKGTMKSLLDKEKQNSGAVFDQKFIDEKTFGFDEFIENLEKIGWEDILQQSGLTREQIEQAAEMYAEADRTITCWAMGVTQHKHAVETIQDIANLHFLRGNIGRQGAGLCPVRGHSNVQGDRSMGIWEKMRPDFRANLEKEFNFKTPEKDGFDTVEAILAMHGRRAKVFFAMGGNFLSATPDTHYTAEALRNCNLTAQVLTKLNRTALVTGKKSLILPCLGRSEKDFQNRVEQFVSTENTMLQVQMSKGIFEPLSEHLRSEPWIVAQLAKAVLGEKTTVQWDGLVSDYDRIREAISRVVAGCENYNEKIRKPGGFYMPNPPREGVFPNTAGKALFKTSALRRIELKDGELLMTTIRAHDQFNTTVYENNDRYRGIKGSRRVIFMNEADIAERNLQNGQVVDLTGYFEDETRRAENFIVVSYPIPRKCAATYFPEANVLVPVRSTAEKSNCPTSKLVVITVAPRLENEKKIFSGEFKR
ncbi:MAG TPA: FdhF/YdeP family oxidoreductase [Pyrinomonadaceae bacterium]|nr:FdhF/YdeP family oxidoreductase [Pyrinomonadaceae bacterium]